ncbi:hypothetical protein GUITHDRAFT_82733 [Guillardia theta CCMP2712]|uniref:NAD-dependent epimerase/dehydratase domain-containing protein n=1 Tax=Guillardia theta (strain CCMP2712) TaxID=905079 RepID=L1I751_GUITC|nr:hypothetical protein GUITHDRAFT_82733 [Guillardia theta CCMP2712]EKX31892.1 hypothetical protein GUITHDRAFT_82733 [Guillardia theta CCMP2712]|eukprot:XP_005818872.1 hypothetical protein GUITHDRAFT_82733 [Guillardia theta CCMP2712]
MASSASQASSSSAKKGKILVLGGTGFVGSNVAQLAIERGYEVVALSRRGEPTGASRSGAASKIAWRKGDATKKADIEKVMEEGGFTAVVHAIGMLFETELNKYASGSGSVPRAGSTYDEITRQTAFNAMEAAASSSSASSDPIPFAFVSAAEVRWTFDKSFEGTPLDWLRRYLIAKRAVESELIDVYGAGGLLKPIIVRPSLIWTWDRPGALLPVAAFTFGNRLGLPFVDKPVQVSTLSKAILKGLESKSEKGVYNFEGMERLAKEF